MPVRPPLPLGTHRLQLPGQIPLSRADSEAGHCLSNHASDPPPGVSNSPMLNRL